MLELLESFRAHAGSTRAIHHDPRRDMQEFISIPRKDVLMQCEAATAVAEETVVPRILFEILWTDGV